LPVIGERGERVSSRHIGVVIQAPAADIWNVESGADGMLGAGPDQDLIQGHMVFRLQAIRLRTAANECSQNRDSRTRKNTLGWRMLPGYQQPELIEESFTPRAVVIEVNDIFPIFEVRSCLGQRQSAHALVPDGSVRIDTAQGYDVVFTDLTIDSPGELRIPLRSWNRFLDRSG